MVINTEAGGPAAKTRSIWSGTSTWRPAESVTSRPAIADKGQLTASTMAHSSVSATTPALSHRSAAGRLRECRVGGGVLSAQRSSLAHQLAHGAEFLLGRRSRDGLDGTIELNDPLS